MTRPVWAIARILAAALVVAAASAQLNRSIQNALDATPPETGDVATVVANFLSFFTIQSNIAAAVVLAIAAVWAWTKGRDAVEEPRGLAIAIACVTTYMIVTGIVYNALLRGVALPQGVTVGWSNEILHVIVPLFLLADLLFAPQRRALRWSALWIIVVYPIVWAVYTLVRAPLVTAPATGAPYWYPYPFLDPNLTPGGYLGVSGYIVGIAVAIIGVGFLVIWAGRRRAIRRAARAGGTTGSAGRADITQAD